MMVKRVPAGVPEGAKNDTEFPVTTGLGYAPNPRLRTDNAIFPVCVKEALAMLRKTTELSGLGGRRKSVPLCDVVEYTVPLRSTR